MHGALYCRAVNATAKPFVAPDASSKSFGTQPVALVIAACHAVVGLSSCCKACQQQNTGAGFQSLP